MKEIEVVAAVIMREDLIFCAQRGNIGETALKWEFPGGKIETGESPEEALKREILEELDAELLINKYIITVLHQYSTFKLIMHVFKCSLLNGKVTIKEHINAQWLPIARLCELDFADADKIVIKHLLEDMQ